ncbi:hypothetical protein BDP27DRAFT_1398410 [Rhodocollybia butyracea]|uniref:Zn(2)-C6 fungal-type domain-containing protein n=1 Tax=Rhodocollybia butyracea TaxID=206335 RepID=A0A9P5UFA0_9AGAR|nr:hypothetical protein BDP27DRAFT_1398410 [Rhodocollybia butyracea]
MADHSSARQPFDGLYSYPQEALMSASSYGSGHYNDLSLPTNNTVHHGLTSRPQTRHYGKIQPGSNLTPFAQFLKEDDERFFATFPDAAKAAAQQQQWLVLSDDYRDFGGSAAFSANSSTSIYTFTSATPPGNTQVVDVVQGDYSAEYGSSNQIPYPYPHSRTSGGDILGEGYNPVSEPVIASQDVIQPAQHNFNTVPFYPPTISPEVHSDLHRFQHESLMLSSPQSTEHSPQYDSSPGMDYLHSPVDFIEPIFSPAENHQIYSLSPEANVPASPSTPSLPLPPSAMSPVSMMTPPEQLTLPPLPPEPQSDSEPLADDPSGPSSSKAVLPKPSVKRKRRRNLNLSEELQSNSRSGSPRNYMYGKIPLQKPTPPPVPKAPKPRPASSSTASQSEKKSLALACFFCRGRKIACGPQDPNSADRTCNQCHRRSLKCEYPTESRRGMRKKKSVMISSNLRTEKDFGEPRASKVASSSTSGSTA